jgi:hypothetical protein
MNHASTDGMQRGGAASSQQQIKAGHQQATALVHDGSVHDDRNAPFVITGILQAGANSQKASSFTPRSAINARAHRLSPQSTPSPSTISQVKIMGNDDECRPLSITGC